MTDPRASTYFCACGKKLSERLKGRCGCDDATKNLSYGIRLHTNPFTVPDIVTRVREDAWADASLARAVDMQSRAGEIVLPLKRKRNTSEPRAALHKPRLVV